MTAPYLRNKGKASFPMATARSHLPLAPQGRAQSLEVDEAEAGEPKRPLGQESPRDHVEGAESS